MLTAGHTPMLAHKKTGNAAQALPVDNGCCFNA